MALSPPGSKNSDVKVIVSTDISGLKPGMQEAKAEIQALGNETEATAGKLGKMGQASEVLRNGISSLAGGFGDLAVTALQFAPAVGVMGVGALAAFGLAAKQGADESSRLSKELIMTGNAAGTTVGQLNEMAGQVAAAAEGTRGAIADAMAQIIDAGAAGSEGIAKVAEAAVMLERHGGTAVKKTVAEFARLGEEPAKASAELNKQYNYLTVSVFEQIKALEDLGKISEAAKLAQDSYADASIARMQEIADKAGNVEKVWLGIKDAAKGAWDAMMDVGRADTNWEGKLKAAQQRAANGGNFFGGQAAADNEVAVLQAKVDSERALSKAAGERAASERAGIAWSQEGEKYLSKQEQKQREIAKAKEMAVQAGISELDLAKRLADITEKYAEKTPKGRSPGVDRDAAAVDKLRLEGRAADAGLAPQTIKELDALSVVQRKTNMSMEEYLRLSGVAMANDTVIAARKRAITLEMKAEAEATQYLNELQGKFDRSNQAKLDTMQVLPENVARLNAELRKVDEQAAEARNRLTRMFGDGKLSAEAYAEQMATLNGLIADQKSAVEGLNTKQDAMNASWEVGAQRAMVKYADSARNAANSSEQSFTRAFGAMEDAIVQFSMTGKFSFSNFANSIIADMVRMQARAAMAQVTSSAVNFLGSYFGGAGSGYGQTPSQAAVGADINSAGMGGFAKGGAFGSSGLHAFANGGTFTNQIFSEPTFFKFANGSKFGVMGEAGDEAVMPLARDSSGRLGVRSQGGQSAPNQGGGLIRVVIENNGTEQKVDSADSEFDMEGLVLRVVTSDVERDGKFAQSMQRRYGLNRANGAY